MNKKKSKNKNFVPLDSNIERRAKNRNENKVSEDLPLMLFSFKDFQYNSQIPPGQNYEEWQEKKFLAYMLEKFGYICNYNRIEVEQQNFIKVYGEFPKQSKFKNPFPSSDLYWGVIKNIKGQKPRVAGYVEGNVFYVVFLDLEHEFAPSKKQNT